MKLSDKQKDFWLHANNRWNVKSGATRSGKTYLDYFRIAKKIRACRGLGLIVLLGNTKGTLERNILDPMREIYGPGMVGTISSNNTVRLFGRKVYALGADKKNQVARIQGSAIEYCYGDEITTWAEEVFTMLKSRLSTSNSCFDGTCNPDQPNHWFKKFLDSDADIYHQHYTIDDNPFLDPAFVENLKKEYAGTIYFNRYILGQWTRAEGAIYKRFAGSPDKYLMPLVEAKKRSYRYINIGVDFGGNKSKHTFVAGGMPANYSEYCALMSERHEPEDPQTLEKQLIDFVRRVILNFGHVDYIYCDNVESVLIRGIRGAMTKAQLTSIPVRDARKDAIVDRIRCAVSLQGRSRFWFTEQALTVKVALEQAVWDESKQDDVRLDDGSSDIDTLDAMEYTYERDIKRLIG
ncbi:MAG: phage terminase large subunit [Youngiibacter sp.]|nr:phage terminase large subunit [Youngiibacter sp.]